MSEVTRHSVLRRLRVRLRGLTLYRILCGRAGCRAVVASMVMVVAVGPVAAALAVKTESYSDRGDERESGAL